MSVFIPAVFFSPFSVLACLRHAFFARVGFLLFLDSIYGYAYAHD